MAEINNVLFTEEDALDCNHDWQSESFILGIGNDGCTEHYRCTKCGETKIIEVVGL